MWDSVVSFFAPCQCFSFKRFADVRLKVTTSPASRLYCSVIAYNLGNLLRRLVLPVGIQDWSLTSLQQRLFKSGRRLIRHARYLTLQLAENYLTRTLFLQILGRIEELEWHPT